MYIRDFLALGNVVPVIVIDNVEDALPMAEALLAGGVQTMEITLRTPAGLPAIETIRKHLPEMRVGAGTVVTSEDYHCAISAGSEFIVSPGFSEFLLDTANQYAVPFLPGIATASEILRAVQGGLTTLKFFPAEANGGIPVLKALAGPYPHIKFCPTGGISTKNAADYLDLPNVICVGGSWLTPKQAVVDKNWDEITRLAEASTQLRQPEASTV